MDKLEQLAKRDNQLMVITKTSEFSHVIAHTNLGELRLRLPFEGTAKDYVFIMDAVPYSKEDSEKMMKFLAPILFSPIINAADFPVFAYDAVKVEPGYIVPGEVLILEETNPESHD